MVVRALLLAACVLVLSAAPASAHAALTGSNPAEGAALATAPTVVELTFTEPVAPRTVSVLGPGGVAWTVRPPTASGEVVRAEVVPSGPAGSYTMAYEVESGDGDAVRGSVTFTLTAAVPSAPSVPSATASATATTSVTGSASAAPPATGEAEEALPPVGDPGMPGFVWWLAGGLVLVAAVTVAVIRVNRR